ncbi:MAG TPA: aminotransferase class I/II-fold pyridoxal phosphate-dependent enzyme [Ornithinimicrobium sp.]|uniref:MalY/PatB family protein n=1 Tax=Ornithinimicrobium sp. TaxID=1977084 RepID=UPI002B477C4D|nr:aminotransferase class I/II-fold pyridoxal phosphate-dependent enzyme [Ornithinimicrobium sp.]HKJ12475.1 aminotransferase class I/II-fold pyridoxal phosphate-dependent enzyme [Ornithinimicrobium sp.]
MGADNDNVELMDLVDLVDLDPATLHQAGPLKWAQEESWVIPAWVAEMDFAVAPPIQRAVERHVGLGVFGYPDPRDRHRVAQAFAAFAERQWSGAVDPGLVLLVGDVMEGLALTLRHAMRPGPLLVPTPVYAPFHVLAESCGRAVVPVPLVRRGAADDWPGRLTLDIETIEAHAAAGASGLLLAQPHNPVGRCYTAPELTALSEVAQRYDLHVVSDEIHAGLTLPGHTHVPFASVAAPDAALTTLVSATKAFNMPGLRCAQLVSHRARDHALLASLHPVLNHSMTTLGQRATVAAYLHGDAWLDRVRSRIASNHGLFRAALAETVPQVRIERAEATYLAWLDVSELTVPDAAGSALAEGVHLDGQGAGYGPGGGGHVRVNLATAPGRVEEIAARLARAWGRGG